MPDLAFSMMISLDGYINDGKGNFDWGHIDDAVHGHANDEMRRCDLAIYGRRMYETMAIWETYEGDTPVEAEFAALWRRTDKIVVSTSLQKVITGRTTLLPSLDPDAMRDLKHRAAGTISIAGPTLAASFLDAGLVDEIGIYYVPVVVGDGTPMFQVGSAVKLRRVEEVRFENGTLFMRYRLADGS